MSEWETFCDECYYHLWRVRRKSERGFNDGFHLQHGEEAKALVDLLNRLERERDELLDILRKLLEIIPEPECYDFGHTKEERHAFLEECPVMARYDALIAQATEAAK